MSQGVGRFGFFYGLFRVGGNPDEALSPKRILGGIGLISVIAGGVFLYLRWSKTPTLPQITYQKEEEKKQHVEDLAKNEFQQKSPHHSPTLDRRNLVLVGDAPENRPGDKDSNDEIEIHSGENLKAPLENSSHPFHSPPKALRETRDKRVFENKGEDEEQQVELVVDKTEYAHPSSHHSPPLNRRDSIAVVTLPLENFLQHKNNRGATKIDSDEELKKQDESSSDFPLSALMIVENGDNRVFDVDTDRLSPREQNYMPPSITPPTTPPSSPYSPMGSAQRMSYRDRIGTHESPQKPKSPTVLISDSDSKKSNGDESETYY
jgi:hypothetical protein